ncbi:MAG: response regulator transcription factor [Sideroxydans sp.]|nr:response regulator transcription factor [Sideroxydans sp.]
MSETLKIALMDDQNLCRMGLCELLSKGYGFDVLGAVGSLDALRKLIELGPDVIVLDLRMKPMDGIAVLQQIRDDGCTIPTVILTMSDSETDLSNAIKAGARGFLLKDMAPEDVVDAIRRVAAGEMVVAPSMTVKMIDMLKGKQPGTESRHSLNLLTEREKEILQLLSRGESNKAIAQSLSISYDTVKQHVRHILNKLNLSSRVKAAVLFAKEQNKADNDN